MGNSKAGMLYTRDQQWLRDKDGDVVVGLTAQAIEALGTLVLVDLPPPGTRVRQGDDIAFVESTKAASDLLAPLSGDIVETNAAAMRLPGLVSDDPEGAGWLYRLRPADREELSSLRTEDPPPR